MTVRAESLKATLPSGTSGSIYRFEVPSDVPVLAACEIRHAMSSCRCLLPLGDKSLETRRAERELQIALGTVKVDPFNQ